MNLANYLAIDEIVVEPNACLNYANTKIVCDTCVKTCPKEAITLTPTPLIKENICTGCSLCIAECPTLAFDHVRHPYNTIEQKIKNYPNTSITCDLMTKEEGIKIPCYLLLDEILLINYAKDKKEITFNINQCSSCEKGSLDLVKEHFQLLQNNLTNIHPIRIKLDDKPLKDNVKSNEEVIDGLSRRDFFSMFSLKKIREGFAPKKSSSSNDKNDKQETEESRSKQFHTNSSKLSLKNKMLSKKKLLFNNLTELKFTSKNQNKDQFLTKYIKEIDLIAECDGCEVCTKVCPTNALYWERDNFHQEKSNLMFDYALCINCEKCLVCPSKALALNKEDNLDFAKKNETKQLTTMYVQQCITCKEEFKAREPETECRFCKEEAIKEQDHQRLFDGLL